MSAPNSHKAKNLKPEQERMRAAVARLQKYMATYDQQPMYLDYQDKTFIDDVLYGLGTALSLDYQYAEGFEKFKDFLRKHLEQPHGPSERDAKDAARYRWLRMANAGEWDHMNDLRISVSVKRMDEWIDAIIAPQPDATAERSK